MRSRAGFTWVLGMRLSRTVNGVSRVELIRRGFLGCIDDYIGGSDLDGKCRYSRKSALRNTVFWDY